MNLVDVLRGSGNLEVEADVFPVRYDLAVLKDERGVMQMRGALSGSYSGLYQALDRGHSRLILSDGVGVPIIVTRMEGEVAVVLSTGAPETDDA
jgi:hypothetical protein